MPTAVNNISNFTPEAVNCFTVPEGGTGRFSFGFRLKDSRATLSGYTSVLNSMATLAGRGMLSDHLEKTFGISASLQPTAADCIDIIPKVIMAGGVIQDKLKKGSLWTDCGISLPVFYIREGSVHTETSVAFVGRALEAKGKQEQIRMQSLAIFNNTQLGRDFLRKADLDINVLADDSSVNTDYELLRMTQTFYELAGSVLNHSKPIYRLKLEEPAQIFGRSYRNGVFLEPGTRVFARSGGLGLESRDGMRTVDTNLLQKMFLADPDLPLQEGAGCFDLIAPGDLFRSICYTLVGQQGRT